MVDFLSTLARVGIYVFCNVCMYYVCMYICMYMCIYVRMYVCMYVCMCMYIYIYIYIYIYSRLVDFTARDDFLGLDNKKYQCGFCSVWLRSYGCCNCRKRPPVNRASQVTLHYLEPD